MSSANTSRSGRRRRGRRARRLLTLAVTAMALPFSAGATPSTDPVAAVDWRNLTYVVECVGDPEPLTLVGGRWADPEMHDPQMGSLRAVQFEGAIAVPGHDDVVLANLSCLGGGPGGHLSNTTLVWLRVGVDGTATQLAAVSVPPTRDIVVGDDGNTVIGHYRFLGDEPLCCPEGYATVTVSWVDGVPTVQPAVAVDPPGDLAELAESADLGALGDPAAGLSVSPVTEDVELRADAPAWYLCVATELAPGFGEPTTNSVLQMALEARGFPTAADRADGVFGAETVAAVAAFAEANRDAIISFGGGDATAVDEAIASGIARQALLDTLGVGCSAGVLALEALTGDGETVVDDGP